MNEPLSKDSLVSRLRRELQNWPDQPISFLLQKAADTIDRLERNLASERVNIDALTQEKSNLAARLRMNEQGSGAQQHEAEQAGSTRVAPGAVALSSKTEVSRLREHADECEEVAKDRATTENLHYMNTCDWAYAMAFRAAANEIERLQRELSERSASVLIGDQERDRLRAQWDKAKRSLNEFWPIAGEPDLVAVRLTALSYVIDNRDAHGPTE